MRKLLFISHQAFFTEDTIASGPKLGKSVKKAAVAGRHLSTIYSMEVGG